VRLTNLFLFFYTLFRTREAELNCALKKAQSKKNVTKK